MDLNLGPRAILLGMITVAIASPAFAIAPEPAETTRVTPAAADDPLLQDIVQLSFPSPASTSRELLSHTVRRTRTYYDPVPDMNGDGYLDVLRQTRSFEMFDDASAPGDYSYSLALEVLDGTDGTTLWKAYESAYDKLFFPALAKVGRGVRNGLHIFEYDERSYPATVSVTALHGSGKKAWRQTIPERRIVALDHINSAPGRATDLLVGYLLRQTQAGHLREPLLTSTSALVIDGRGGRIVRHPSIETRVGRRAVPLAAPDLDGDKLEDYVFVDEWDPYARVFTQGEGHVVAREGREGDELWESEPVLTGHSSWVTGVADLDGNQRSDLVLETELGDGYGYGAESDAPLHALEGKAGSVLWSHTGWLFEEIGDIDRDGTSELMTATPVKEQRGSGVRVTARGGSGRAIYSKFLEVEDAPLGAEFYAGLYSPGDLDGDGHPDLLAKQTAYSGRKALRDATTVSSRTGRAMSTPEAALPAYAGFSQGRDDLLLLDRTDDDVIEVEAPWRNGWSDVFEGRITATGLGEYPYSSVQGGHFYPGACPGLFITLESSSEYGGPSAALMVDAATGRARWSHGSVEGVSLSTEGTLTSGCAS
ncbi:MAG: VCBS repeat-containing protein [Actinomycetota bacterium]|nr:VCBS repeat-containing protein [Actinomycetota bacterium]